MTGKPPLKTSDDPALLRAVLCSIKSIVRSQSSGSRRINFEDRLAWEPLVQVFGSETAVREAVINVRKSLGDKEVLQLADKYLSGWKPKDF